MSVLSKSKLELSRSEFESFSHGKSKTTQDRYWRAWREYHRSSEPEKPEYQRRTPTRTKKETQPPERYQLPREYETGPIRNDAKGNRYAIVTKVTAKVHGEDQVSYHSIIQADTDLTATSARLIKDHVRQRYGASNVRIDIVQTIDRLTGDRVKGGVV